MNVNLDLELYFGFGPALRICTAELILDLDSGHWTVFLGSEVFFFYAFFWVGKYHRVRMFFLFGFDPGLDNMLYSCIPFIWKLFCILDHAL